MNGKQEYAERIRQEVLTRSLGQITCPSTIHGLWCGVGARCSFCQAEV